MKNLLKGGLSDKYTIYDLSKKHNVNIDTLKKQLEKGKKVELEHTNDIKKANEIAMDHLFEDPKYYTKLEKIETTESMDSASSGSFESSLSKPIKRKVNNLHNSKEMEIDEITDSSSSGQFDVPAFGKTTKGGRKDPLKIDGPKSIYQNRAVKDKNFPKWGGPNAIFVKVKEKCKKFPYCNQGNTGAIEFIKENKEIKAIINEVSKEFGLSYNIVENSVIKEINNIFIYYGE